MRNTILHLLWLLGLTLAQDNSYSQSFETLSGSARRLTSSDVGPSVPSDFEGSTIMTGSSTATSSNPSASSLTSTIPSGSSNATISMLSASSTTTTTTAENTSLLGGTRTSASSNNTISATSTTSPPRSSNTQPCNNYAALCTRKYSNITEVCAHNSPFVRPRNVASNQAFGVTQQLNDGIRVLQGQAHLLNGTLYYCHTSCDLLNVGTVEDYLRDVTRWLAAHPFEVLTIIFGNYGWRDKDADGKDLVTSANFADPVEKSGLLEYIYQPPKTAMTLDDWPTLGEMILAGKRVVTFLDYNADTAAVPWLLWEFYNVWETPFSPTNLSFPCDIGRPDGLGEDKARELLYMANHNLNTEIAIAGLSLLVPNTVYLNQTNGVEGPVSLTMECTGEFVFSVGDGEGGRG
jgi:hypothetical protein